MSDARTVAIACPCGVCDSYIRITREGGCSPEIETNGTVVLDAKTMTKLLNHLTLFSNEREIEVARRIIQPPCEPPVPVDSRR